jgi:transcriptional regulator with XRE-family HTH domain
MENNIQQKEIKKNARQIINENFFGLLKERKISLKEYAKENGLDPSTISKWKSGNSSMNTEELSESLNKAMSETKSVLLFSSHDRQLLSTIANRIIYLRADGSYVDKYLTYEDFEEYLQNTAK